ncbi:MAG: hypothetical protein CLLPBCKN_001310 [Chroococcidiopsis cubana SAG 39.79]|nr:hypothetical protein [Chroococcidiopsis cubana SAG 39.79]
MSRLFRITILFMDAGSSAAVSRRTLWVVGISVDNRALSEKWGFTPQKPLRRAYEQDPLAVKRWIETEYPQICREAHREGAEIHWGDEMGCALTIKPDVPTDELGLHLLCQVRVSALVAV